MRHWLWRVMGVLSLGGGFSGLVFLFMALMQGITFDIWVTITVVVATALYGFGVWSGMRLLEGRPGAAQVNLLYWCIQIPMLNTPAVALQFYVGATAVVSASLGWDASGTDEMNIGANAVFGSSLEWSLMQGDVPWEFGVNLLACLIVWKGRRLLREEAAAKDDAR